MRWCSWENVGPVCSEMDEGWMMIWCMKVRFCALLDTVASVNSELSQKDSLWAPENKGVLIPWKLVCVCLKTNNWANRPTKCKGKYPWCFCSTMLPVTHNILKAKYHLTRTKDWLRNHMISYESIYMISVSFQVSLSFSSEKASVSPHSSLLAAFGLFFFFTICLFWTLFWVFLVSLTLWVCL